MPSGILDILHEVSTAYLAERAHISRHKAATIVTVSAFVIGCGASLSMGPWSAPIFFGMNFFDFLDYVTAKLILPITGMGAALFVGWKMTTRQLWTELTSYGTYRFLWIIPFKILVRYIIPSLILFIMITQLFDIKFS